MGEVVVRYFTNFKYTSPPIFSESRIIPWELKPNVHTIDEGYWREFHVAIDTNALGYRDREFPLEKPKGTFRILVLGDSFTFGYGVEGDRTYPKVLEHLLNDGRQNAKRRYEVINAGYASGYAPDTAFVYLRHKGILLKPDLVLLGYFGNDIFDVSHTQWPDLDPEGLPLRVTTDIYYIDTLGRLRTAAWLGFGGYETLRFSPMMSAKVFLRDHSQFLNFLIQQYRLFLVTRGRHEDFDRLSPADKGSSPAAYEKVSRVLTGFKRLTRDIGSQFVVVRIPSKNKNPAHQDPLREEDAFIKNWCHRNGISLIDLGDGFARTRPEDLYFKIDPHFNARGHAVAADVIYNHLMRYIISH